MMFKNFLKSFNSPKQAIWEYRFVASLFQALSIQLSPALEYTLSNSWKNNLRLRPGGK